MKEILVNNHPLDEEQLKPILENPKHSMIIAGAGSGKTLTLIGKMKYLLENEKLKPEEICCLSFTNEAVNHMKDMILKNCHTKIPVFTFHKLALNILQKQSSYSLVLENHLIDFINLFFENECFGNQTLQKIIIQSFHPFLLNHKGTWAKILSSAKFHQFKKTIITFLHLLQSNGLTKEDFKKLISSHQNPLILVIYAIYLAYEKEKEEEEMLDFEDIITKATTILKTKSLFLPYKFILVDEFQDTSWNRFHFLQELVSLTNAKLCVVGDDYQSIYHFSGSDINLFLQFQKYYPDASLYKLQTTYRTSKELISIASHFIMKNPYQIKKELVSNQSKKNPITILYTKNLSEGFTKLLAQMDSKKEILLLGRTHFDLQKVASKNSFRPLKNSYLQFTKYPDLKIRFLTIHASKGLESDIVIVLNNAKGLYGFPSNLKDDKILQIIKKKQFYPFEEERRLFYVALTRAKQEVYLLTPLKHPSSFIQEIKHEKNVKKKRI